MFTEEVISKMMKWQDNPIIFALSNPTSKAECTAEEAYRYSEGRAISASGSPFDTVEINGEVKIPGQGNNAYIFPGFGLGVLASEARRITDTMLIAAAQALADTVTNERLAQGSLYPPLHDIERFPCR
jgi:malate dehydrogenase (oxaloacetate-decarboxylating)(NADP+)